jgi:cell wall-associated NlpC family hydrolase
VPKAREGSKSAVLSSEQAMHSFTVHATATGTHAAREAAMQMAKRQQMTKAAETAVQKTAQAVGRALRSIIAAAQSLLAAIAAGGSTVVAMVLVICLIGLLIVSPFGIFFSGEDSGTGYTMPEAVSVLNGEFATRIEQIKAENPHDELDMDNAGSAAMISNWRDVLAVYAVRTTTDNASPDEVATLTEEKMEILREIFWDMNAITYWAEIVPGGKDEADTVILHITVTIKTHLQMADEYQFNTEQRRLLEELMQPKYQELFMALTGSYQDIELSPDEVAKIIENLPADLSENRKQVVLTAYQLLGKVHYFWGGKSLIIGWDSRWGMPMKVTAEGSSTTGTVRPFGLDCSGMVDWVFYNQSGGQYVIGHGGGATAQHSYCTPIAWSDAQPGDLVFYPGDSHVGIVCGFDSSGNIMVIHCASSANNVVVTGKIGFTSIGRPEYFAD